MHVFTPPTAPCHPIQRMRPTRAVIDPSAISQNVSTLKSLAGSAGFMAVVKADGYGHGASIAASAALRAGADCLGVALIEEAIHLRHQGFTCPIQVLGSIVPEAADLAARYRIVPTVTDRELIRALAATGEKSGQPIPIQIKIDTGMSRLGFPPEAAAEIAAFISQHTGLTLDGCMTHLATADAPDLSHARRQVQRFMDAVSAIRNRGIDPGTLNAANTAATLSLPDSRLDRVRCGIGIYGLYPDPAFTSRIHLNPAMTLETRILHLKTVPAHTAISYGRTHITASERRIATLPIGYADGYPRCLSNTAVVRINGTACPLVGRVCMDMCMVDVTEAPDVSSGDRVILFGRDQTGALSAETVAGWAGTINYEITSAITARIPREIKGN
ncbi:MAG: alanine racemase [Deltaproteobacteria bacterium]|nr:MAG: alanine racemase [Deltaproteobacteria bacterium]